MTRVAFDGNTKDGSLMAGQVCGQLKTIRPLEEIFAEMTGEADRVMRKCAADKKG